MDWGEREDTCTTAVSEDRTHDLDYKTEALPTALSPLVNAEDLDTSVMSRQTLSSLIRLRIVLS